MGEVDLSSDFPKRFDRFAPIQRDSPCTSSLSQEHEHCVDFENLEVNNLVSGLILG